MRGRKQDYWMSCSIVLKNTKQNATSTASGNKKPQPVSALRFRYHMLKIRMFSIWTLLFRSQILIKYQALPARFNFPQWLDLM